MSLSEPALGDALVAMGYPLLAAPAPATPSEGEWLPLAAAAHPDRVGPMVSAYTRWLGLTQQAAGGACALQHYAGRVAVYAVGTWALTGGVVSLHDPDLLAEVDEHGRTLRLAIPRRPAWVTGDATATVEALQAHVEPLLDLIRDVSHITSRLAWGGVATSVAGAFVRAVREGPEPRRATVVAGAHQALDAAQWPEARPLVTLAADATGHIRRTCCLIFLSPTHQECTTCPRLARQQH